jgi:hypothetical protein
MSNGAEEYLFVAVGLADHKTERDCRVVLATNDMRIVLNLEAAEAIAIDLLRTVERCKKMKKADEGNT